LGQDEVEQSYVRLLEMLANSKGIVRNQLNHKQEIRVKQAVKNLRSVPLKLSIGLMP
jgi:hypothetical protein